MNFKFKNLKKTKDNVIIEEEEDDSSDEEKEIRKEKSKEKKGNENLDKKNSNKFEISQSKISLDKKVTDYIAFLLNNQVKLDNMEMVIDITLSEVVFDSFYHKLNDLSTSLSDLYIDFSSAKIEETLDGTYTKPSDLIPLCEDRLMFFKYDFKIKNLSIDLFLREDKEKKKWMYLLLKMTELSLNLLKQLFRDMDITVRTLMTARKARTCWIHRSGILFFSTSCFLR
jgi:hypothetical protein